MGNVFHLDSVMAPMFFLDEYQILIYTLTFSTLRALVDFVCMLPYRLTYICVLFRLGSNDRRFLSACLGVPLLNDDTAEMITSSQTIL